MNDAEIEENLMTMRVSAQTDDDGNILAVSVEASDEVSSPEALWMLEMAKQVILG